MSDARFENLRFSIGALVAPLSSSSPLCRVLPTNLWFPWDSRRQAPGPSGSGGWGQQGDGLLPRPEPGQYGGARLSVFVEPAISFFTVWLNGLGEMISCVMEGFPNFSAEGRLPSFLDGNRGTRFGLGIDAIRHCRNIF